MLTQHLCRNERSAQILCAPPGRRSCIALWLRLQPLLMCATLTCYTHSGIPEEGLRVRGARWLLCHRCLRHSAASGLCTNIGTLACAWLHHPMYD